MSPFRIPYLTQKVVIEENWGPAGADILKWMSSGIKFVIFVLAACVAVGVARQFTGRAPRLTDKDVIARQGEYQWTLDESRRTGKPVVLDFYTDWCGPCRWMRENAWNDPRVVAAMRNYLFMPVNVDANRELSKMFGVEGIPHVVVISPDGKVIGSQTGAVPPDRLLAWLPGSSKSK
jgi:thiol:disulfide interchange protein